MAADRDVKAIDHVFSLMAAGPTGTTSDSTLTERETPPPAKRGMTVAQYFAALRSLADHRERKKKQARPFSNQRNQGEK